MKNAIGGKAKRFINDDINGDGSKKKETCEIAERLLVTKSSLVDNASGCL